MGRKLQDKIAVITGSTSGIGEAVAKAFAAEGASVVVSGRREDRGEKVVEAIRAQGGKAVFEKTDVSIPEDCERVCKRAEEEFGGLDILVNNAGIFPRASFEDTTAEFWDKIFQVNLRGAFLCCKAAVPLMRKRGGGSIINIGSCHAFQGWQMLFAYGCSKAGLYALTMNLARILAKDRIRVNWITVGWVLTEKELEVQEKEGHNIDWLKQHEAKLPMGQYNTLEDIVAGCLFLASDESARITGTDLNISAAMCIKF